MDRTAVVERLLSANHKLTRIAARSTGSSISSAVWSTLSILCSDGPHRVGDLARAARISQPGMTKILHNLVADDWVRRVVDREDSRAWIIAVTGDGRDALDNWRHELAAATQPIFAALSDEEWLVVQRATSLLTDRIDAVTATP